MPERKEASVPRTFSDAELLARVDHDLEFLQETVQMLAVDGRALMAEVRRAADAGDAPAVGRAAHTLKGMISNFCAPEAQACALAVEKTGKSGDLSAAALAVAELDAQLDALIVELGDFLAQRGRCAS